MTARKSRPARLLDDTMVVGLVMIAAAAVVLYLSFQAQTGLPWKATERVELAVPDSGKLMRNADVRIGGARVGQVVGNRAVPARGDVPAHAILDVKLDADAAPLPVDSEVEVRLASVLGGKYVSIVPGRSNRMIPEGGRLPLENAASSVDIEDALQVFGPEGRDAIRRLVGSLGDGLAGRGGDLNETIEHSARLLPGLERVLATLTDGRSDLQGFLGGAAAGTTALAAVAPALAAVTGDAATTLGALDAARDQLAESIAEFPSTADSTRRAMGALRPVLDDATAISRALRPASRALGDSASAVDGTVRIALRADPRIGTLAAPIDAALDSVDRFAANPAATSSLTLLGSTDLATFGASAFVGLGAILATVWEAEEHCAIASTWMARLGAAASDGDEGGNWLRMIPFFQQDEFVPAARPAPAAHVNPYPNQNAQECEAGNEGYAPGQLIGNPPGLQGGGG